MRRYFTSFDRTSPPRERSIDLKFALERQSVELYRCALPSSRGAFRMDAFHRVVTHSGPFHADDVLAVAVLIDLVPDAEVVRTRDPEILEQARKDPHTVLVDVGWSYDIENRNFDHHQRDFHQQRTSGVPFASIGLVWQAFGDTWLKKVLEISDARERDFVFQRVDEDFIASIDAFDCGVVRGTHTVDNSNSELRVPSVANLLGAYNPVWFEPQEFDQPFQEARRVASGLLRRQARVALSEARFGGVVENADDGSPILVLPTAGPWRRFVKPHHLVVVFPAVGEPGFLVQAIGDPDSTQFPPPLRISYPEAWRGQEPDALKELTGVDSVTFCHRAGFIGGATTRTDAIELAKQLVKQGTRPCV